MPTAVPNRLREVRECLRLPRAEVARRAGLHYHTLRLIEEGKSAPRLDTARRIAAALATDVTAVFPEGGDDR